MAPTRKTRKVNKKLVYVNEERLNEEGSSTAEKSKTKKRKLVDLLGPRWTKKELKSFYGSYRKYGKDWKKVSGTVCGRTSDMVEALYNMNRAYLSLSEGAATAAGLIAMMTDHYSNVGGNNDGSESDESPKKTPSKTLPKNGKGKQKMESKDSEARNPDLRSYELASSNFAALSVIRKKHSGDTRPRAVGKRTPRIPVVSIQNRATRKLGSPSTTAEQDDDEGDRMAAMVLVDFRRGGLPQVSYLPSSDVASVKVIAKNYKLQRNISKAVKFHDEGEGTLRSRKAQNKNSANSPFYTQEKDTAGIGGKTGPKSKMYNKKKQMGITVNKSDGDQEALNNTEGHNNCSREGLKDDGDAKSPWASKSSQNGSRLLCYGDDECDTFSAFCTLAVNSLQHTNAESESLVEIKDDNEETDSSEMHSKLKAMGKKDKRKVDGMGPDDGAHKKIKTAKQSATMEVNYSTPKPQTGKKHKPTPKIAKHEAKSYNASLEVKGEVLVEEENVTSGEINSANQASIAFRTTGKFVNPVEPSPSMTSPTRVVIDGSKILVTGDSTHNSVKLPIMSRSHRKSGIVKAFSKRVNWHSETTDHKKPSSDPSSSPLDLTEKLSHTLSNSLFLRWCRFEWFYSAIDYPWFVQNEFVEWLNYLKHYPKFMVDHYRLTRNEWGLIRGSLGKPRRFSVQFLKEERVKLTKYRELVREQYKSLLTGKLEALPTDFVCPLFVGQNVIACYPKSRELHEGSILSIDGDHCRVQFDRTELGVEYVSDIDCMSLNPVQNMPKALKWENVYASELDVPKFVVQGNYLRVGALSRVSPCQSLEYVNRPDHAAASDPTSSVLKQDKILERGGDIRSLSELSRAINKKAALLLELRNMNDDILGMQIGSLSDLKQFKNHYATVVFQLQEVNDQVDHAFHALKQCYTNNKDTAVLLNYSEPDNSHCTEVAKLMDNSRQKAKMMVGAAVQAMLTTNKDEDPGVKIGEVLDRLSNCNSWSSLSTMAIRCIPPDAGHPSSTCQQENPISNSSTFPSSFVNAESSKMRVGIEGKAGLPSELISACISTYLMIQSCTEKQHPPADVTHMLDLALSSMQPYCPENVVLYRDIESCINTIKKMMLALIPTPTPITPMSFHVPITR